MEKKHLHIVHISPQGPVPGLCGKPGTNLRVHGLEIESIPQMAGGLLRLAGGGVDAVLLDLAETGSEGTDILTHFKAFAPDLPTIVLAGKSQDMLMQEAIRLGAQDCILRDEARRKDLAHSLHMGVERQQMLSSLRHLAFVDELTGLLNFQGFHTLGRQELLQAQRAGAAVLLLYADLDNLKVINDTYGHAAGDLALQTTAGLLRTAFRSSDLACRIGGDEFAVLIPDATEFAHRLLPARLEKHLNALNASLTTPWKLSFSAGLSRYNPQRPCSLDELLRRADRMMYRAKHERALSGHREERNPV